MQHHRGQHSIEFAVGVRQPLGVAALEADAVEPDRLSLCALKSQRIGIRSDDLHSGKSALGPDCEISGAAADFQDAKAAIELGLFDQLLVDPVEARQASHQVITRQECIASRGGSIVMWMMFEHAVYTALGQHCTIGRY